MENLYSLPGTVQYSTERYNTVQYSTVQQNSTVQYSSVQYSTVQYSTVLYSTVHYSTVLLRLLLKPTFCLEYNTVICVIIVFHYFGLKLGFLEF